MVFGRADRDSPLTTLLPDTGTARAALDKGRAALEAGLSEAADAWIDRAARLAPGDPTVDLLRASALIDKDRAACREAADGMLLRHPRFRDAYILRIACEVRDGQTAAARHALTAMLRQFAPPEDEGFRRLADEVARDAGAPGWLGLTADGTVVVRALPRAGRVELLLDGVAVKPGRPARLPPQWREARELRATCRGESLIGAPLPIAPFARTEGVAEWDEVSGLTGWARYPADPDRPVTLHVRTSHGTAITLVARDEIPLSDASRDVVRARRFSREPGALPEIGEIRVLGTDKRDLAGSPLWLGAEQAASVAAASRLGGLHAATPRAVDAGPDGWRPLNASLLARMPARHHEAPSRPPLDVVIPVYRGVGDLHACLATLRDQLPRSGRIVVIDDGAPDPELRDALEAAAAGGAIHLLRHAENRGFPAAANSGLRFAGARDVLLLNSDTLLPPGALARLADAAYHAADIGSVTPMTNDGTILSYPRIDAANPVPDMAALRERDAMFREAHGGRLVDIPTGVGFCMFLRHDCLAETGLLREDAFAQGYGEENDWCLRASHLGWRHVAAAGVFVAHVGGQSFGAVKSHLIGRNVAVLNRLHPGYDRLIADFVARDPLAPIRRGADMARWRMGVADAGAMVLVTHDMGGGVARHVRERCAAIRAQGMRPVVLHPGPDHAMCRVTDGTEDGFHNLAFALPGEFDALVAMLADSGTRAVELHHLLGHSPLMLDLAARLGVPLDVYIHDYAQWCPRITLVSHGERYCGEPARIADCVACVADLGERIREAIGVAALRARSAALLGGARAVIVPSEDAARRIQRHFSLTRPLIRPWEDDEALGESLAMARASQAASAGGRTKIVVAGAIGTDKGFDVLLACARDAARRDLELEFVVVGHTADDGRLLDTGRVFVTGRYEEAEGAGMVMAQNAALGFIPSVWPETWCYALSTLWRGGLRVAAFDIGAQAERIRRADAGTLLPLGLPAPRVNDQLLRLTATG